jgi:signal transduction histidine kinase
MIPELHRVGIPKHIAKTFRDAVLQCLIAGLALILLTVCCYRLHLNLATACLLYVIVVALLSRAGNWVSSIIASVIATLCLARLAPPAYSFRVDDPLDDVAIVAFLITSFIIARLVSQLRQRAEEALSTVNRGLIDAEERERARIAKSLHDDIGQRVALLQVKVEQLRTGGPSPRVEAVTGKDELLKQIELLSTDIQGLAHSLHSPKLEYLGLVRTMNSFCKEFAQEQKMEVHFRSEDLPSPPPLNVSVSLFRVLQEALHNSAKHSGVRQIEVELSEESNAIHLIVRDSGLGFNPEQAMKGKGLGLISMQERMKLVHGEFSIDSQLKRGTTIHAKVSVKKTEVLQTSRQRAESI